MARGQRSLMEMFYRTGGLRNAHKAGMYLGAWLIAVEAEGHELTVLEYSRYWGRSEASSYREREALRACLPEGVTCDQCFAAVRANVHVRMVAREGRVASTVGALWGVSLGVA